ncbi:hypothetical protein GIB67_032953 [Kingdonia uniflora]|uniref:Uncharacterized protein n=1 Tax=Kingdonia uniflora TaxID=39325 RepID=A0A7J7MY37_9MAGN|nr:hypothetical protein GIB67_032953 [Kingdonia uniflora]
MAFKAMIFLLVSLLLVTTKVRSLSHTHVSSNEDTDLPVKVPAPVTAPLPAPTTAPKFSPVVSLNACPGLCGFRCSKHSKFDHCMRACKTCCQRCRCVPPSTYGNKEMCGKCYAEMKTHNDEYKCP